MIPVYWWSPDPESGGHGYWAQAILDDVFAGNLWQPESRYTFEHHEGKPPADVDGCVLVIPARFETPERFAEVQAVLDRLSWVVMYYTSDEEQNSAWWDLRHPNMFQFVQAYKTYVETPNEWAGIPFAYTTGTREAIKAIGYRPMGKRIYDWSFAGQITHDRRFLMRELYEDVPNGFNVWTKGFSQGLPRDEYFELLAQSKVVPAPGGPITPDSFRMFEALEAQAVPHVDELSGIGEGEGYWTMMFGEHPFLLAGDWTELLDVDLTVASTQQSNFWRNFKRSHVNLLHEKIHGLSGIPYETVEDLTVIITAAPSFRHPDTGMIENVVDSIRHHHPTAPIIITNDGVPDSLAGYRDNYNEYLRRLVWLADHHWTNVVVITHDTHVHQSGTTQSALKLVKTPLVLAIEHDMGLTDATDFNWSTVFELVKDGTFNLIRYQIVPETHPAHLHMMIGGPMLVNGVPLWKTTQWSQRPFLISTEYYKRMAALHFPEGVRDYVENRMHGVVSGEPWEDHRLALFSPEGSILRAYHLDGRGHDESVQY